MLQFASDQIVFHPILNYSPFTDNEESLYLLSNSCFSLKQFDKAAHVLEGKSSHPLLLFLKLNAKFMVNPLLNLLKGWRKKIG